MNHSTLAHTGAEISGTDDRLAPGHHAHGTLGTTPKSTDCSGFAVFSHGNIGAMHVFAHEIFDGGDIERGHEVLGTWLASRSGSGSDWIHLQFHMAVFELTLGDWDSAYARFMNEILPVAASTPLALTDAPGLLWRLEIAAPVFQALPWVALRPMAEKTMSCGADDFTTLHQLLVLAGVGDSSAIADWRRKHRAHITSIAEHVLRRAAHALECIARCDYAAAARRLHDIAPKLPLIGGSFAQNDLFRQLERWCLQQQPSAGTRLSLQRAV